MKNTFGGLIGSSDTAKERISDLENRSAEITDREKNCKREKRVGEETEQSMLWNNINRSNISTVGIL